MKFIAKSFALPREPIGVPRWFLVLASFLSVPVALVSYRYLAPAVEVPSPIEANKFVHPWLFVHAGAAATALLLGPAQFFRGLRARFLGLHRWAGRVYVAACAVGAISGLVLAAGAATGRASTIGFGALAVAWLISTTLAWCRAMQGRICEHQAWMMRSFALTLSAVTLRIYLAILEVSQLPFVPGYQAISFLCWIPNIVLVELYLRRQEQRSVKAYRR